MSWCRSTTALLRCVHGRAELRPEGVEMALADVEHRAQPEELGAFRTLYGGSVHNGA